MDHLSHCWAWGNHGGCLSIWPCLSMPLEFFFCISNKTYLNHHSMSWNGPFLFKKYILIWSWGDLESFLLWLAVFLTKKSRAGWNDHTSIKNQRVVLRQSLPLGKIAQDWKYAINLSGLSDNLDPCLGNIAAVLRIFTLTKSFSETLPYQR